MVVSNFIELLENPKATKDINSKDLKTLLDKYPYFQSARALYLKALKSNESFKYNNELKVTAAYTTDRTILFDFITSDTFEQNKQTAISTEITKTPEKEIEIVPVKKEQKVNIIKQDLNIGKPLSFKKDETHSFNQWLQLSSKKPIGNNENNSNVPDEESKKSLQNDIINNFIANNPKISKPPKDAISKIKITETHQSSELMTETLARVYLEQKKYDNAIKAYKILSLKYPEKSGFFADQIKQIQILQNINN